MLLAVSAHSSIFITCDVDPYPWNGGVGPRVDYLYYIFSCSGGLTVCDGEIATRGVEKILEISRRV